MIKAALTLALGAVGALEGEKLYRRLRDQYRPAVLTGTVLDKLNRSLERRRAGSSGGRDRPI